MKGVLFGYFQDGFSSGRVKKMIMKIFIEKDDFKYFFREKE